MLISLSSIGRKRAALFRPIRCEAGQDLCLVI